MTQDPTSSDPELDGNAPEDQIPEAEGSGLLLPDAALPAATAPSEPYQVLARKWRPHRFSQVVGQAAIVRTLSNALDQGRIAHAYCFSGIRGVGKTTIARLMAKGLNCQAATAPTSDPCGECDACREIEESRSLDVVEMDAASQTGVDNIRQLNEFARYTPSRDRYRVFIFDEAHMLSASSFNALLKTLEEPPPHVVFMLATTEPHKILPTVLSRCQQYHLGRISLGEISARLREISAAEGVSVSDDALALVATAADGSMRDAQSLLDKLIAFAGTDVDDETVVDLLGLVDRELLYQVVDLIAREDLNGVLGLVNGMVEQGVDLHQFTLDLLGHLRGLLVVRTVEDAAAILHLPDVDLARMREQAAGFEIEDVDRAFALLSASEYRIKQSEVPRYHLEMVLGRLARLPRLEPLADLINELRGAPTSGGGSSESVARGSSSGAGRSSSAAGGAQPGGGGSRATSGGSREALRGPRTVASGPGATAAPSRQTPPAPDSVPPPEPAPVSPPPPAPEPAPVPEPTPAPGLDPSLEPPALASVPLPEPPPIERALEMTSGPDPEPASQAPAAGPPVDAKVDLILQRLRDTKPMIAQVLARAETIEMRDEVLWISFPANRALFKNRLEDKGSLEAIEEAGKEAIGRSLRVMTGIAAGEPAPRSEPETSEPTEPSGAEEAARRSLWQRAEEEPMVKSFLEELGGQLTEVEEI